MTHGVNSVCVPLSGPRQSGQLTSGHSQPPMGDKKGFGLALVCIPLPYCSEKERACLKRQTWLGVGDPDCMPSVPLWAFLCLRLFSH